MCADGVQLCTQAIASVWGLGFALVLGSHLVGMSVGFGLSIVRKL